MAKDKVKEKLDRLRGKRGEHKGSVTKKIKETQQLLDKITESQEVSDNDRSRLNVLQQILEQKGAAELRQRNSRFVSCCSNRQGN